MNPEEQAEYVEIICQSFTEIEIEHLETFASWSFELVDRGVSITMPSQLILETLQEYEEPCLKTWGQDKCVNPRHNHDGGDEDAGTNG